MLEITIKQTGAENARAVMSRMLDTCNDLRPVWPQVEDFFREVERTQFASEGGAGESGPWPGLSGAYARRKERDFPGMKILQRTQRLIDSLIGRTSDTVVSSEPKRFLIGTTVPYARYHQERGFAKHRPPISLTNRQIAGVQVIIHRYFNGAARNASQGRLF